MPQIADDVFIAPGAHVIGKVSIGAGSSIWFNCVLRGDVGRITVGERTNIQDGTIVHVTGGRFDTHIGDDVLIGHACIIHGCRLENHAFVGMGAIVLDGAVVEPDAMLAAGALLTPGKVVKSGELWAGRPAKFLRSLTAAEIAGNRAGAAGYARLAQVYRAGG
ncbi:gamma carbonic anhydrase family protein [Sandarakinorhabdus limnophila]|jgi:carbonic anhydrase/acetyltransferase-like protein (isoleucine patch superfamily)|uniref:gamma carbonic anhydrase family protein n=2 Tax=Sandarakinorhabdus limnophila TaxID=210512 RepID=UPI0004007084|nr:gamma carbonic anhydrase family protein [Sandarakinorhabdus limnophila]